MRYTVAVVLAAACGTVDSMGMLEEVRTCLIVTNYAVIRFKHYLGSLRMTEGSIPGELEDVYDGTKDYIKSSCPASWVGTQLSSARTDFLKKNKVPIALIESNRVNAKRKWKQTYPTRESFEAMISDAIKRHAFSGIKITSGDDRLRQWSSKNTKEDGSDIVVHVNPAFNVPAVNLRATQTVVEQADEARQQQESADREKQEQETARQNAEQKIAIARVDAAVEYAQLVSRAIRAGSMGYYALPMPQYPGIQKLPVIPDPVPRWEKDVRIIPKQLSVEVQKLRRTQQLWDSAHTESIPYLLYDGEVLGDLGRITLGTRFIQKEDVLLFYIKNDHSRVIKYQSNCYTLDEYLLDLERDYWFQELIAGRGIGPRVHFMSPPVKLPGFKSMKTEFELGWRDYMDCVDNQRSYMRYMVMDRIPASLYDLMSSKNEPTGVPRYPPVKFEMSLNLAISVISKLEDMHNLHVNLGDGLAVTGIVHGDVHPGNIVQLSENDYTNFGLLDFGKALFSTEIRAESDMGTWDPHCFLSHYNMKGAGFSYRDDVYKTLLGASFLMTGTIGYDYCKELAKHSREAIINFHSSHFLFDVTGSGNVFRRAMPGGSDDQRTRIADHLREALRLVREVDNVDDKPPYTDIIRELDSALKIFKTR